MLSTAKSSNVGFSQVVQLLYILALCQYTPFDYTGLALCIASKSICTGLSLCIDSFCYTRSCQKTLTTLGVTRALYASEQRMQCTQRWRWYFGPHKCVFVLQ